MRQKGRRESDFDYTGVLWADGEWNTSGDHELLPACGSGKRIVLFFYRKGNVGDGENVVAFKWEANGTPFFKGRMWYCGVELATLIPPRKSPENKSLIVNLSSNYAVNVSVAYKIERYK